MIDDGRERRRRGPRRSARFTYDIIDQKVVDGAVNGVAEVTARPAGSCVTSRSGRVQRYALLLFAAVGLLSLALLIAIIELTRGIDSDELVRRLGADPGGLHPSWSGMAIVLLVPQAKKSCIKIVALLTSS